MIKDVTHPLKRLRAPSGSALFGLTLAFCTAMQPASAQSESSWSNQGLIYLLGPTLSGTANMKGSHS